jgi:asparaginyl-tRNA synthetase
MDYRRQYVRDLLKATPGTEVTVYGWVKTRRDSKGISFVELSDGSSLKGIQIIINDGVVNVDQLKKITTGSCISVEGKIVESPAAGQAVEVVADKVTILGEADPATYPMQKKGASMEYLREKAHLRARGNTFGAVFRVRSEICYAIHKFFNDRGFYYIHTPIITASDAEGAGAMFSVTTLLEQSHEVKLRANDYAEDFFEKPAYLTVSGQLEAETLALALTNVYTFGPTFRAENSNSARHLAEFWMIEPEMAFCDLEGDMNLAEEFIKEVMGHVLDKCPEDMAFFNQWIEKGLLDTLDHVINSNFERMTYTEAIKHLENSGENFEFPVFWGADLQSEHERWLTEKKVGRPVILTDYPKDIKAFYMKQNDDGKTVRAMDVLCPRIGEIIGGSQREENLDKLENRIKELGLPMEAYWWYLDLRRFGSAPHSGFGLGLERLVLYMTGMKNIRDVIPFHRTPGSADF